MIQLGKLSINKVKLVASRSRFNTRLSDLLVEICITDQHHKHPLGVNSVVRCFRRTQVTGNLSIFFLHH